MDQFGDLVLNWSVGYNGSSIYYIDQNTICYLSLNSLKFHDITNDLVWYLESPGDGIKTLAVNPEYGLVAFSEDGLDASIFVYKITSLESLSTFKNSIGLGFSSLAFANNARILASCTNIPKIRLSLWDFVIGKELCFIELQSPLHSLIFNPTNWKQLSGLNKDGFYLWNIDQVNENFYMEYQNIKLPDINETESELANKKLSFQYSNQCLKKETRHNQWHPVSQCWTTSHLVYIGCSENSIICVDAISGNAFVLYVHTSGKNNHKVTSGLFECIQFYKDCLVVGGKDGVLRYFKTTKEKLFLTFEKSINGSVGSLQVNQSSSTLVVGSHAGVIYVTNTEKLILNEVLDESSGKIIGIHCFSKTHFITCRENGFVQVWTMDFGRCIGHLHLSCKITCSAVTASSCTVFLGTTYGSVIVIDVSKNEEPRTILEKSLYRTAVSNLCFDDTGILLITTSENDHLILLDARLSTMCNVLGHTEVSGAVKCISFKCTSNGRDAWKVVLGVCHNQNKLCKNLVVLEFDKRVFNYDASLYINRTRLFKDISILKQTYQLTTSIYNICILSEKVIYALIDNGKKIAKFLLSPFEVSSNNRTLEVSEIYYNQTVFCSVISISFHGKWMLIAGADGYLTIREIEAMNNPAVKQVANYRNGGIIDAVYSVDGQNLLLVSSCNHIACLKWVYSTYGKSEAYFSIGAYQNFASTMLDITTNENKFIESMKKISVSGKVTETWLEETNKKNYAEENDKYLTTKSKLLQDIHELRCQVLKLISNNDQAPDIDKLERQEFILDTKEHDLVLQQRENKLNELRAQIEFDNIGKQYIRYLVKQECWDNMLVKGCCLKSFLSNVKVSNCPMRKRSDSELKNIMAVNFQCKLQNIEKNIRKVFFESELNLCTPLFDNLLGDNNDDNAEKENFSTWGSLSSLFTHNQFLQSQFLLVTKVQKKEQIILLKDCIHKIKEKFNVQFNETWNMKVQEIKRINERCARMKKIVKDLDLNENIIEIGVDSDEEPERVFDVRDNEISVKKHLSKEEKMKAENKRKKDEEINSTDGDNNRGYALDVMMGGRLDASSEMELNYDIQKPNFMEKPEIEWSEEECKLAKEYEKKKQTMQEERDKYKKILEAEFKKLQTLNQEAISSFDEKLQQLFQYKIKADLAVAQEELKMMRLVASISISDEMEVKEHSLLNELIQLKEEKQLSSIFVSKIQSELDTLRISYENLVAEDKYLDKMFRKEFPELDQFNVDLLYKLFKKRPQVQRTLKAAVDNQLSLAEENKFELRVPSLFAAVSQTVECTLNGLDSIENKPDKILVETWSKLTALRRVKFEKEQQLKSKALVLAQMNIYMQKKKEYDSELKFRIEKTSEDIQKIRDERLHFNLNLEVQLLLKQGQVEVGVCDLVPDYTDCILFHRSVVENLNSTIKALGQTKLASMRESKDFRKGIHLLEWQLKEMLMQSEDLQTVAHDLQILKVTKELQVYLSDTDLKLSKQQEIETLENTLEMYKKIHQRSIKDKKRIVKALRQEIKEKTDANDGLKIDLQEIALSVEERQNVNKGDDETVDKKEKEKKMMEIITRQKLVDLTRAQSLEINLLRSEAVNLRKCNFPILLNE